MRVPLRTGDAQIVLIVVAFRYGGQEQYVVDLAAALQRRGHPVTVLCNPNPELESQLRTRGIPAQLVLRTAPQIDWRSIRAIVRLIRQQQPVVVHLHGSRAGLLGMIAAVISRFNRVIWHVHVGTQNLVHGRGPVAQVQRWLYRMVEMLVTARCAAVVGVSEATTRGIGWLPVGTDPRVTIQNGVSQLVPSRPRAQVRAELGYTEDQCLVVMVAKLNRQKAVHIFLQAMAHIRSVAPQVRAYVVGEGPLRPELESQIQAMQLETCVQLLGWRSDVADLMGAADLCALSSDFEGLPLVLLEAMSLGLPVVATGVDGTREAVENGVTGWLVDPGDARQFAHRLLSVVRDPELRQQMGLKARSRYQSGFSHDRMVGDLIDLYQTIDGSSRGD